MFYLIDGYNLLFAMGVARKHMGPDGLEKARRNLLAMLRGAFGDDAASVTVVFDAAHPPPGVPAESDHQGIRVRFAVGMAAADDLIELLIEQAPAPKHLTVVSDDHRIQKAAKRRRCVVCDCGDFLLGLQERRRPPPPPAEAPKGEPAKPSGVSREETQHWLEEFADLADDPAMKELQGPPEFFEEE